MELAGKVALVTGAGSGIGKATAILLAQQGARVAALSHTADEVEQTVAEIERSGKEAIATVADTTQEDQMQKAVQQMLDRWGRIDIVFANAGINGVWAPIEELSLADWTRTITTNLTGTFLTLKYTVPHLKKQGGSIVITSSVNGTRVFSNTGATAYSATKAGQVAITKMLAVELGPHNIRVNVVCPGYILTPMQEAEYTPAMMAELEAKMADLEGGVRGMVTASGMGAISSVLLGLLKAGDHVVLQRSLYGGTYSLVNDLARRFGVESTFVDPNDLDAVRAAIRPETRIVYAETIANPTMAVADLPGLGAIARETGTILVVDNTIATPYLCRPIEYGAGIVVHSATKYLGGHSDVVAGVAVKPTRTALVARSRSRRVWAPSVVWASSQMTRPTWSQSISWAWRRAAW